MGAGVELIDHSVGEPNDVDVVRAAMTVTASVVGGDAPGGVDHVLTMTLPFQRPILFQDSAVEMQDHVSRLETAFESSVDCNTPRGCAKVLRDIVFRVHFNMFRRAFLGNPSARNKPVTVRLHPGVRVVRANVPPECNRLP